MRPHFNVDFGRAAFAVALAILLYFVALNETNPQAQSVTAFTVPVQPVNVPPSLVVIPAPDPVKLLVQAPNNVLIGLRAESFTAQVDASTAVAGDNDNLPVVVNSTDPQVNHAEPAQTVRVHLEEVRPQDLPVRVNITGQVPPGYQLGTPTVAGGVTVTGAASLVGRATEAVVDVSVSGVTVSINGVYTPRVLDDHGNALVDANLRISPPSLTVQVPIIQTTLYKQVGIRTQTQGQPAPGYVVQPLEVNPSTATLVGDSASLEGTNFVDTSPVDITGISTTIVRTVGLVDPPGTFVLQRGQTVTVTVRVITLSVNQTVRVPPTVINLSGSVQLAHALDLVSVTISGPAPALSSLSLNPQDFKVVLDVNGKGPGRWDVDVKVQQVPQGLTAVDFSPKTVQVDLSQVPPTPTPVPVPSPTPTAG